jgi:hypothetical protein
MTISLVSFILLSISPVLYGMRTGTVLLLFFFSFSLRPVFLYLVDYLFGGLSAWRAVFFVCVIFFLSPWMDQPSLRYQMVYAIFMEIIIPIPYSIFHTRCYM